MEREMGRLRKTFTLHSRKSSKTKQKQTHRDREQTDGCQRGCREMGGKGDVKLFLKRKKEKKT